MADNLAWRIWYGDFSTYSNRDGALYDAPAFNVQLVTVRDTRVGRRIYHLRDYYWYDSEYHTWMGGDINGLWDYLARPGPRKVLFGREIHAATYERIVKAAYNDPDFPAHVAHDVNER